MDPADQSPVLCIQWERFTVAASLTDKEQLGYLCSPMKSPQTDGLCNYTTSLTRLKHTYEDKRNLLPSLQHLARC